MDSNRNQPPKNPDGKRPKSSLWITIMISVAIIIVISNKLNILTEQQRENEEKRSNSVMNLITVFGIVSILASVLSIIQILCDGNEAIWIGTILTSGVLAVAFALVLKSNK